MYLYRTDSQLKLNKMKNFTRIFSFAVVAVLFMTFLASPQKSFGQDKVRPAIMTTMPDNISGILKNSCVMCHSSQSNGKAKIFMNLSNWDSMSKKKQAKEGKAISKQISKGNMPPAGFLEKRPQAKLTADQIASIATWSHTLKRKK